MACRKAAKGRLACTLERIMAHELTFRPRQRLCRQRDIDRVFSRRCSTGGSMLVVYVDRNQLDYSRICIKVSKKVGRAVTRNHVRRRIREAFRLQQQQVPFGLDIVCIAKAGPIISADTNQLAGELLPLIERARGRLAKVEQCS